MIHRLVFSFLKNVFLFLIDRLYNEWVFMNGKGSINRGVSERGDLYAKQLIDNMIHDHVRKCEPYIVNRTSAISYGPARVVSEKAYLSGLNTLHRVKKCFLTDAGNRRFLNATFRAGPLIYQREILFKFGYLRRKIYLLLSLANIKVSVDLSFEKEAGRNGFLQNFTVNKLKGFELYINGLGYFDWIINLVISFLTFFFGRMVRNLVENELEQYILYKLPKYQFPVDVSHRNETKFSMPPETVQNDEASLYKTCYIKQNYKRPKSSRVPSLAKKTRFDVGKACNATESGSNHETTKCSKSCSLSNNCMTEVNSFYLSEPNLDIIKGYLPKNSSVEILKDKSKENCYYFSALPKKPQNISSSLNEMKENLVSISNKRKSPSQEIFSINTLNDTCELFDCSNSVEMNDENETESNSREGKTRVTSFRTKSLDLKNPRKVSVLVSERLPNLDKESETENSSQRLQDFCENLVEMAFEGLSERLNDISAKLRELSYEKIVDENTLDAGIEMPSGFANYNLSLIERESSQIDVNTLEREDEASMVQSEIFLNTDPNQSLIMFSDEVTEEQKILKDSIESCSHYQDHEADSSASSYDSELSNAEMDQKDFVNMDKDCANENDSKVLQLLEPGIQTQIEETENSSYAETFAGNQSFEMPKHPHVFIPAGELEEGQTNFKIEVISDLKEFPLVKDEMEFETETETTPSSRQFSEKHEDEVNEKIQFKYLKDETKDATNRAGDVSDFEDLSKSPMKLPKIKKENRKIMRKLEIQLNGDFSKEESSSEDELKFNEDYPQTCFEETTDLKDMDVLQKEIIKTLKLKSNFKLGLDSEGNENADNFPVFCIEGLTNLRELDDLQKEIIIKTRKLKSNYKLESDSEGNENADNFSFSCKNLETEEQKYPEREDVTVSCHPEYPEREDVTVSCHPEGDRLGFDETASSSESDNESVSNNLIFFQHEMVKMIEKCTEYLNSEKKS